MRKEIVILFICVVLIVMYIIAKCFYKKYKHTKNRTDVIQYIDQINIYNKLYPRKQLINIPVYYINMDKDVQRNQWMLSQLSNNVSDFKRVPGVNGKLILNKNMDKIPYNNNDNNKFISFKNEFDSLSHSEIGCILSHLCAIKTAYENNETIAIIMEDDVYIDMTNILDTSLEELIQHAPKNWEIIQLVHIDSSILKEPIKRLNKYTYHEHKNGKMAGSTCAYVINRKGMEKVLSKLGINPFYLQKDSSIFGVSDSILYDNASTIILHPSVLVPYNIDMDSTIHTDHTDSHIALTQNILKEYKDNIDINNFNFNDSSLKLLNIIIYNENETHERLMKKELEIYLQKFNNFVTFYFVTYRQQQEDIILENNCIYIKGTEGFIPQVLNKTIIATDYCVNTLKTQFDFLIRSNISSVINFDKFPLQELTFEKCYSGPQQLNLNWLDIPFGINEQNINEIRNTKYVSGTSIIMSNDVVNYLLEHQSELDNTIIDDVSIGVLLSKVYHPKEIKQNKKFLVNTIDENAFVIRNKSDDRYDDVKRMQKINKLFPNWKNIPFVTISYNSLTFIKNFIDQLKRFPNPIIIIDNASTYKPLKSYFMNIKHELRDRITIHQLDYNYGHTVYLQRKDLLPSIYILSDPDLELHKDMPLNASEVLLKLSEQYKAYKVGSALDLSDKDNFIQCKNYTRGKSIYDWESQFWEYPINNKKHELYNADIDTTLCLVNLKFKDNNKNIRVAGNFTAKHLPWYKDYIKKNVPLDEIKEWKKNNKSSSILFDCLRLYDFPNEFVPFLDKIFYINLDTRKDRREKIEHELDSYNLEYERFNAIKNKFGALGCYQSHLTILKLAKERNYKNVLILEDDFTFVVDKDEFKNSISKLQNVNFDICMISYNMLKSVDCEYPFLKKVIDAQTTSGYIVNNHFFDKLIYLLEYYMPYLEKTKNTSLYAIDMIWKKLQPTSRWYHFTDRLGIQREDYSDIENKVVNYNV